MKNIRLLPAALLVPVSLMILLNAAVARAELTLDPDFDTDGLAVVDIDTGPDVARDIALQADGALVLAGRSRKTVGADAMDYVALTRLNGTTGAIDGTFGTAGIVTFLPGLTAANGAGGEGRGVAIQPLDQKIIVAGTWRSDPTVSSQVFVARFGPNGLLDASFGTGGVTLFTPAGMTEPAGNAIALRSDGSIAVVGSATADGASVGFVAVLDSTGALDSGYALSVVPNPLAEPAGADFGFNAVAVLSGDRILAAGGGGDLTLAQFTGTGAPDPSFDSDGIATFNFLGFDAADGPAQSFDVITALAVRGDGRILMAGRIGGSSTATSTNRVLGQVTSSGVLDTTFGSGGYAPLVNISDAVPEGLGVRPSGDVVLVGQGFTPMQISPNGIAVSSAAAPFPVGLNGLALLDSGDVVGAGAHTVSGINTAFAAVRLTATDLADGPDTVPDPFGFATQTGLEPGVVATSNTVTITGLTAPAPISVSSGDSYSIGCSDFTTAAGTITNGNTVCVRAEALQDDSRAKYAELNIGGAVGLFTLITGVTTPEPFTFTDRVGVLLGETVYADPITITGITVSSRVEISQNSQYQINCAGPFTRSPGVVRNNETICVRHVAAGSLSTLTNTELTVGGVSDTFTSTTVVDKPLPGGSAMDVWSLGLLAPLVAYRRRRGARRSVCRSAFRRDRQWSRA